MNSVGHYQNFFQLFWKSREVDIYSSIVLMLNTAKPIIAVLAISGLKLCKQSNAPSEKQKSLLFNPIVRCHKRKALKKHFI